MYDSDYDDYDADPAAGRAGTTDADPLAPAGEVPVPPSDLDESAYTMTVVPPDGDIEPALRLRYRVFAEEMGASLHADAPAGMDRDEWDELCDHLLIQEKATGEVVGTYRLLPPDRAAKVGGRLYSDGEFDLRAIDPLRSDIVEVGRSCVDPAHRKGAVVALLWAGIARYMIPSGHKYLAGCASLPLDGGGANAAAVWRQVRAKHMGPPEYRVYPRTPWPADEVEPAAVGVVPPLVRGYLRLGAWVCGDPAWDQDFNVADVFILLEIDRADQRYVRRFLGV